MTHELYDEREAARFLKVSTSTLRSWRRSECGPEYIRMDGRMVRYSIESLREYVKSKAVKLGNGEN